MRAEARARSSRSWRALRGSLIMLGLDAHKGSDRPFQLDIGEQDAL